MRTDPRKSAKSTNTQYSPATDPGIGQGESPRLSTGIPCGPEPSMEPAFPAAVPQSPVTLIGLLIGEPIHEESTR